MTQIWPFFFSLFFLVFFVQTISYCLTAPEVFLRSCDRFFFFYIPVKSPWHAVHQMLTFRARHFLFTLLVQLLAVFFYTMFRYFKVKCIFGNDLFQQNDYFVLVKMTYIKNWKYKCENQQFTVAQGHTGKNAKNWKINILLRIPGNVTDKLQV